MPSGYGSRCRTLSPSTPFSIGTTTAQRYAGAQNGITVTGSGFPSDLQMKCNGVNQTTVYLSANSATFDLAESNLWEFGTLSITATSATLGNIWTSTDFVVTAHPNQLWIVDPTAGFTVSGSNMVSIADQSGNGYTMTAGTTVPKKSAAQMNGRDAILFDDPLAYMRSTALADAMHTDSAFSMYRVVKSVDAHTANEGIPLLQLNDNSGNADHNFFVGGTSSLIAGETWTIGATATRRRGGTITYTAGETWVEEVLSTSAVSTTLTKNGTGVTISLTAGPGTGFYAPNSTTFTGTRTFDIYGCRASAKSAYLGIATYFNANLGASVATQVRKHYGSLFGVTVT